jgi:hypothetical protein
METAFHSLLVSSPLPSDTTKEPVMLPDPSTFDFHSSVILQLCRDVCREMQSPSSVLHVYSQRESLKYKDSNNRMVWFRSTQQFAVNPPVLLPNEGDLAALTIPTKKPRSTRKRDPPVASETQEPDPPARKKPKKADQDVIVLE